MSSPSRLRPWLAVMGATGTGKTKLALQLAQRLQGEIVNTDAMQLYKGLDIACNKATQAERALAPHHLLDVLDPFVTPPWTVVDFRRVAVRVVEEIEQRGHAPILVGGTHYYLESLLFESTLIAGGDDGSATAFQRQQLEAVTHNTDGAAAATTAPAHPDLLAKIPTLTNAQLHQQLAELDPAMAQRLHPNNIRKIRRSLEIYAQTGRPQSQFLLEQAARGPVLRHAPVCLFWLDASDAVLQPRLDARVDAMVEQGLLAELLAFQQQLQDRRPEFLLWRPRGAQEEKAEEEEEPEEESVQPPQPPASEPLDFDYSRGILQAIGLKEFNPLLGWLNHHGWRHDSAADTLPALLQQPEAQALVQQGLNLVKIATRQYAKRQLKWIRLRLQSNIPNYYIYKLDTSDPEKWDELVLQPALDRIHAIMENRAVPSEGTQVRLMGAARLSEEINHYCEACGRTVNGAHEWQSHLGSKRHKRRATLARQQARRSEQPAKQAKSADE